MELIESELPKRKMYGTKVAKFITVLLHWFIHTAFLYQLMQLRINGVWMCLVWGQPPTHHLWMGPKLGKTMPRFPPPSQVGAQINGGSLGWKPWNQWREGLCPYRSQSQGCRVGNAESLWLLYAFLSPTGSPEGDIGIVSVRPFVHSSVHPSPAIPQKPLHGFSWYLVGWSDDRPISEHYARHCSFLKKYFFQFDYKFYIFV